MDYDFSWQITYGTVLKLMHERTKFRLHSHDVPYGSGSGQQSVTGFPNVDDANSYWVLTFSVTNSAVLFLFVRGLNDLLKKNSGLILGFDVFET